MDEFEIKSVRDEDANNLPRCSKALARMRKKAVLQNDAKFETKERLERKSISRGGSRLLL